MKTIASILFTLCLLLVGSANAQDVSLEWMTEHKSDHYVKSYVGETDSLLYVTAGGWEKTYLECYRKSDMKLLYSKHMKMKMINGIWPDFKGVLLVGGKPRVYATTLKSSPKASVLLEYEVETDKQFPSSRPKSICERPTTGSFYLINSDEEAIKVGYTGWSSANMEFETITLDHNGGIVDTETDNVELTDNGKRRRLQSIFENGKDNSCALVSSDEENGAFTDLEVISEEHRPVEIPLPGGMAMVEFNFQVGEENNIMDFACFYRRESAKAGSGYDGMALRRMNLKTGETLLKVDYQFSDEVKQQFLSDDELTKGKMSEDYKMVRMLEKQGGGYFVVAELQQGSRYSGEKSARYGHIMVMSISPELQVKWVSPIYKNQNYQGTGSTSNVESIPGESAHDYYGHLLFSENSTLCFIFNDNPENVKPDVTKNCAELNGYKDAVIVKVVVDSQGNVTREILETDGGNLAIQINSREYLTEDTLFVVGSNGKKDRMGLLTIKFTSQNGK